MAPDQNDDRRAFVDRERLARRLRAIRLEVFGVHGGPELARLLGLTARAWWEYESGAPVPVEVMFGLLDLTSANLDWLLDDRGPKFLPRAAPGASARRGPTDSLN